MENFLGIIAWFGCWCAFMINLPDYQFANVISSNNEGQIKYSFLKMMKRVYGLLFIILLNLFCFISNFFVIAHDLKFALFIVNIIFFLNALWEIVIKSYNNNYISVLQSYAEKPVKLSLIFDICENEIIPTNYKCNGIFALIKGIVYYKDDTKSIKLTPKKFGQKKSPINANEIMYIVSQLNNNKNFNKDIEISSFYENSKIYKYSKFILYDEVKDNKFRNWFYKIVPNTDKTIKTFFSITYFVIGIISIASVLGSNWFPWFIL